MNTSTVECKTSHLQEAIEQIYVYAKEALAVGATFEYLITCKGKITTLDGIRVVLSSRQDHEYLAWLVQHLADGEGMTWAGYAAEVSTTPKKSTGHSPAHSKPGDALFLIIASKEGTIQILWPIDKFTRTLGKPEGTVLDRKPLP